MTGLATKSVKYSRPEYFLGGDSATKQTIAQKRSAESSTVVHTPRANGPRPVQLPARPLSSVNNTYR
jgi:hypothetical protein